MPEEHPPLNRRRRADARPNGAPPLTWLRLDRTGRRPLRLKGARAMGVSSEPEALDLPECGFRLWHSIDLILLDDGAAAVAIRGRIVFAGGRRRLDSAERIESAADLTAALDAYPAEQLSPAPALPEGAPEGWLARGASTATGWGLLEHAEAWEEARKDFDALRKTAPFLS